MNKNNLPLKPEGISDAEWQCRLDLAALYRLFDYFGWTELVFNHISARVPNEENHYLINPYGLWYNEVTATNLVKIDALGQPVQSNAHPVNPAGFLIHSAIHSSRHDAQCVIHTHTTAGCAVASKKEGLKCDNFYSANLYGNVAYHDFEGIVSDADEGPRLLKSLGDKNMLILRNHGLLALGSGIPEAFRTYWRLQRACEIQVMSDSMQGESIDVANIVMETRDARQAAFSGGNQFDRVVFEACLRRAKISREDLI